jgi:hypothetical protein
MFARGCQRRERWVKNKFKFAIDAPVFMKASTQILLWNFFKLWREDLGRNMHTHTRRLKIIAMP